MRERLPRAASSRQIVAAKHGPYPLSHQVRRCWRARHDAHARRTSAHVPHAHLRHPPRLHRLCTTSLVPPASASLIRAVRWHVQLQRARKRVVFTSASSAPDDIRAFPAALTQGFASPGERFVRQASMASIKTAGLSGGASSDSFGARTSRSSQSLSRQQTISFRSR